MTSIDKLPFPRWTGIKHNKDYELPEDLYLEQWLVPKGTVIKLITGKDFGYVMLPQDIKTSQGYEIPKRLFKW